METLEERANILSAKMRGSAHPHEHAIKALRNERRLALEEASNGCDHWGPSSACSAEVRALEGNKDD